MSIQQEREGEIGGWTDAAYSCVTRTTTSDDELPDLCVDCDHVIHADTDGLSC